MTKENFKACSEAYETLSNVDKKSEYDNVGLMTLCLGS
jgi:DnaJ-class molecular chaperone